jgi:hypothetical protein
MSRYSNLSELSIKDQKKLLEDIIAFFSPFNNEEYSKDLNLSIEPNKITPLSLFDFCTYFCTYYKDKLNFDLFKNQHNLLKIVDKMVAKRYLTCTGSKKHTGALDQCYLFLKEFSKKQKEGYFWITEILGFNYLIEEKSKLIIHLTGKTKDGDVHAGTGILINKNTIITCAHVLNDMKLDEEQEIQGKKTKITFQQVHKKINDGFIVDGVDVGVIKLKDEFLFTKGLAFSDYNTLDKILILGFPKIPHSSKAELISQTGEINGSMDGTDKNKYIIFSTITRPGNSGGPIFNSLGNVVGIVTREALAETLAETIEKKFKQFPFWLGIPLSEIKKAIYDIDPSLDLPIENFE